jgi:hypothetical protein
LEAGDWVTILRATGNVVESEWEGLCLVLGVDQCDHLA